MKNCFIKTTLLILSALVLFNIAGCSEGGGDTTADDGTVSALVAASIEVAQVSVEAELNAINVYASTYVTATAYDNSGSPVAGVLVNFALDQPSLAAISPSIGTTDGNGNVRATLTARDKVGSLKITASSGTTTSAEESLSILSGVSPDAINVTATPTTIMVEGTAAIQAEVLDQDNNPVPDGTSVAFEVSNDTFGSMSPVQNTTVNGFASSTFAALNQPGTATVEVSVGAINNSVDILINQSQPGSLEFFSAEPQRITIAGSGGIETSDIKFRVIDENGNPVSGIEVTVTIEKGPNGGENIDNDATPLEITVSSDADGLARVILRSGTTAGPVTLKGVITIDGVTFTANSSVVSIGGGVPSASRFSVAATVLNIPGLDKNNVTTDITAYMSDRYGNYNILQGTTVSFWSEAALAVDAATATLNEDGLATVTARTQHPILDVNTGGQNVARAVWEDNLLSYVNTTYGWPNTATTTHPRDGLVSVLVYTQGEEHFDDLNANGIYDAEPFQDTHDDPFLDYNDNDSYDDNTSVDPTEIFNDVNSSGGWDSVNGLWDSQKDIFSNFNLLITGDPFISIDQPGFVIADGGAISLKILICDRNLNYLSAGTKISMSISVPGFTPPLPAALTADEVELDDSSFLPARTGGNWTQHLGRIEYNATIIDLATGGSSYTVILTVTVEHEGRTYAVGFPGTVLN